MLTAIILGVIGFLLISGVVIIVCNYKKIDRWIVRQFVEIHDDEWRKEQCAAFKKELAKIKKERQRQGKGEYSDMRQEIKDMIDQDKIQEFKQELATMPGKEFNQATFYAVSQNKVAILQELLNSDGGIYLMFNLENRTPLMEAIYQSKQEAAMFLAKITQRCTITYDAEGNTDLHYAVSHKNEEVINAMLETCSDKRFIDVRNNDGYTAYELARVIRAEAYESKEIEAERKASRILGKLVQCNCTQLTKEQENEIKMQKETRGQKLMNIVLVSGVASNSISDSAAVSALAGGGGTAAGGGTASASLSAAAGPVGIAAGGAAVLASASYMIYKGHQRHKYNKGHNIKKSSSCIIL